MGIHRGNKVRVGSFDVYAAGAMALQQPDILRIAPDLVVDLAAHRRFNTGLTFPSDAIVITNHLEDFGGVPADWRTFVNEMNELFL